MRLIDGNKYYVLNEIAEILDIPYTTLYLRIKADEERADRGEIRRYPAPMKYGSLRLWEERDIPYMSIAKHDKIKKGYGSSYKKLKERIRELEQEVLKLGGAI
jgi:hypothetical protein